MPSLADPQELASKGEEIYDRLYRHDLEREHLGEFVLIDLASERAFLGNSPEAAYDEAQFAERMQALEAMYAPYSDPLKTAATNTLQTIDLLESIDFANYKTLTIGRRVERRLLLSGEDDVETYAERLENDPEVISVFRPKPK